MRSHTPPIPRSSGRGRALLTGLLLALAPAAAGAQGVEGSLVRSEDGAPVAGATVILLDQAAREHARTATDSVGAFSLEAPGEGVFMLMVEQRGFANYLSDAFTLASDEVKTLHLTLALQEVGRTGVSSDTLQGADLVAAAMSERCQGRFIPTIHAIAFGVVRDQATGEPIPGATARFRWSQDGGISMGPSDVTVRTDEAGTYVACTLPGSRPVSARAEYSDIGGTEATVQVRTGNMRQYDLEIPLSDPNQPGNILGRVMDYRSGAPLAGADVRLRDAGITAVTNDRGIFTLPQAPSGLDVLEVSRLGYGEYEMAVQVVGGRAQQVEVRMAEQAVELPPMLVSVRSRRWFTDRYERERRIDSGFGVFLTLEDLEERRPSQLGDALRGLPGVSVTGSGGGLSGTYIVQLRGASTIDSGACLPTVWVDGQKVGSDPGIYRDIQGFELETVEVYRGPAETPGEFSGGDARCGVIVVWTKRGSN